MTVPQVPASTADGIFTHRVREPHQVSHAGQGQRGRMSPQMSGGLYLPVPRLKDPTIKLRLQHRGRGQKKGIRAVLSVRKTRG